MEVTHFGHSCVLLDTGAARLLIDPGNFSTDFEDVTGLDAVLVTPGTRTTSTSSASPPCCGRTRTRG